MKRAAAILVALAAAFGISGSVDAATASSLVAGSVVLSDGSHLTISASLANNRAQGATTFKQANGTLVRGSVDCIDHEGTSPIVFAQVTQSTNPGEYPVGSQFIAVLYTLNTHRVVASIGGVGGITPYGDGTCDFGGYPTYQGYVISGVMFAF